MASRHPLSSGFNYKLQILYQSYRFAMIQFSFDPKHETLNLIKCNPKKF